MNPEEIREIVQRAGAACIAKDAEGFAALFAETGEIILSGYSLAGKAAIQKATADYLAVLAEVEVEILRILVEGEQAAVEWRWRDRNLATGRQHCADNAIIIDFKSGLITRWREYKG